jgi:MoaA/NifB/PqqE/SkfB family radical SAM enzyme
MAITTLGLILGYTCNIRCRHCLWGDALNDTRRMTAEEACSYIDMAYELGTIRLVGLSGGESFLFKPVMKKAMYHAAKTYRLPSSISTNSSWAISVDKARSILRQYHNIGLRRLQLSVDDFHQEWVPLERVKNALIAARELEIKSTLVCVVTTKTRTLEQYLEALEVERGPLVEAAEVPCTPVGFGGELVAPEDLHKPDSADGVPSDFCSMLNVLNILPDGSVQMCCGAPFSLEALRAGNAKREDLKNIVERAEWNPIFNALSAATGPRLLAEALKQGGLDGFLRRGCYASSCDACQHIMGNRGIVEFLYRALDSARAELFLERFVQRELPARAMSFDLEHI